MIHTITAASWAVLGDPTDALGKTLELSLYTLHVEFWITATLSFSILILIIQRL